MLNVYHLYGCHLGGEWLCDEHIVWRDITYANFAWWVSTIIYPGVYVNLECIIIIYPGLSKHCTWTNQKKNDCHFCFSFSPPSHYSVFMKEKECNQVWQICSINSNDDALAQNTYYLHDPKSGLLLMCLIKHLIWCLDSDTWSLNINQHRQQTTCSESELWTQKYTHTPPSITHPFYKFQYFHYLPNQSLCTGEEDRQTS
jgi:hypothetical protein